MTMIRTDSRMRLCIFIGLIGLQFFILQSVDGNAYPVFQGSYSLPQQLQSYQNRGFSSGSSSSTSFYRRGGRFQLPQPRISFQRQDTLGYNFDHQQNAPTTGFFNSGNFQQVGQNNAQGGTLNLPTFGPFQGSNSRGTLPTTFSHPRFPFSSQRAQFFPQEVQQNVQSNIQNTNSAQNPSLNSFNVNQVSPNPTTQPGSFLQQYYNQLNTFPSQYNQNAPQAQQYNQNAPQTQQYNQNTQQYNQFPQFNQNAPIVSTKQPSFNQNSEISFPQNTFPGFSNQNTGLPSPKPTFASIPQYNSDTHLNPGAGVLNAPHPQYSTIAPAQNIFPQENELPGEKSITYQFNPDSSITPLQKNQPDIPSLANLKSYQPTNSATHSNNQDSRTNQIFNPSPTPFTFLQNQPRPQQGQQRPQQGQQRPQSFFPPKNIHPSTGQRQFGQFNRPQQPPPFEPENGYNPNHLEVLPEPPFESEFLNLPPLNSQETLELESYVNKIRGRNPGRRAPPQQYKEGIIFPRDDINPDFRIVNPTSSAANNLSTNELLQFTNSKPLPIKCAYNTITQSNQGEDCVEIK